MASWEPDSPSREREFAEFYVSNYSRPQHLRLLPTPRPETRWDRMWAFLIVFTVGLILTLCLLVIAGQRGHATAGWTWDDGTAQQ